MADEIWVPATLNQFRPKPKERKGYIKAQKKALMEKIGEAQATLLLQETPKSEIRKRPGPGKMQFEYVEHAYVTETLNWATLLNWDLIVTDRERVDNEVIVHGYLEVRFPNTTVKKYGTGGAKIQTNNPAIKIADAYKSATSDLLKVCAARLGLGLDLYRSDDSKRVVQEQKRPTKPKAEEPADSNDPATTVQIDILKREGVKNIPDNMTKGQARELIKKAYYSDKK